MLNYTLIAGILLYLLMVRVATNTKISYVAASLTVVLGYFAISTGVQLIMLSAYGAPLNQLLGLAPSITLVLQLAAALLTFYSLERNEETYIAWLAWGGAGAFLIFFAAPYIAGLLF